MALGISNIAALALAKRLKNRKLPSVDVSAKETEVARGLEAIKEHLRMYEGDSNNPRERFVTMQELQDSGLITVSVKNKFAFISQVQGVDIKQAGGTSSGSVRTTKIINNNVTGASTLEGLSDTNVAGVSARKFLRYSGTSWVDFDLYGAENAWVGAQQFQKPLVFREQSGAPSAQTGLGYLWTKDDSPNSLYYTDGAGTSTPIVVGGAIAYTEVNDLTAAVTWANIPIANVPTGTSGVTVALGDHTHVIANVTDFTDNSTNWDTAYGWGDHASGGYAASGHAHELDELDATGITDGFVLTADGANAAAWEAAAGGADLTADESTTGMWTLDGDVTLTDFGTGGKVKDGTDVARAVGFNVIPVYEIDVADSFDLAHIGFLWHKDANGAIDFTCDNVAAMPQGATQLVINNDTEDVTIAEGAGVTVYWFEAGSAPASGDVVVSQGGVVTVYKYSDTVFYCWGAKSSAGTYLTTAAWTNVSEDTSDVCDSQYEQGVFFKDGTGAITLTLEASGVTTFSPGMNCAIINAGASADITVTEGSGTTLYLLTGTAVTDTTGGCTVGPGGYATLYRHSATVYFIMGAGITA